MTPGAPGAPLEINAQGGSQICVPRDLSQAATYVLLEQEDWFEDEIRFLRSWLRPGMRAMDVGANYGVYTASMARSVGPSGRVWSFEPTTAAGDLLRRTLDLNGYAHVELSPAAISDRVGSVAFATGRDSELNRIARDDMPAGTTSRIAAVTLDHLASLQDISGADFLKIDVEGHEPQVIAGGAGFFSTQLPLVMLEVMANGRLETRALNQLAEMEYRFFRLVPGLNVLAPVNRSELDSFQLNLFACRQSRAEALAAEDRLTPVDAASPASPEENAWEGFLQTAPYAGNFARLWPERAGVNASSGTRLYFDGLSSYAHCRDLRRSASERLSWLRRAFGRVQLAIEQQDTLPRAITRARIAWDLGLREVAAHGLHQAAMRLRGDGVGAGEEREPFLAPSLRYEKLAAVAALPEWLECAVLEQFEKARAHSSLYGGENTLAVLEPVFARSFRSPESERRRQLRRMSTADQSGPEAHPLLCRASDENLNPGYWCPGISRSG